MNMDVVTEKSGEKVETECKDQVDLANSFGPGIPTLKEGSLRGVDLRYQSLCNIKIEYQGESRNVTELIDSLDRDGLKEIFGGCRVNWLTTRFAPTDEKNAELVEKLRQQAVPITGEPLTSMSDAFKQNGIDFKGQTSWCWYSPETYSHISSDSLKEMTPVFGSKANYLSEAILSGHDIHDLQLDWKDKTMSVEDFLETATDEDIKTVLGGVFWESDETTFIQDEEKDALFKKRFKELVPELSSTGNRLRFMEELAMEHGYYWDNHTAQI